MTDYKYPEGSVSPSGKYIVQRGKWVPVQAAAPGAKPASQGPGAETRAKIDLTLGNMVAAEKSMDDFEGQGYRLGHDWLASWMDHPKDGDWIPLDQIGRAIGLSDYQDYSGSAKTIESALLPIFSGASVTAPEAQRYIQANAPETSDGSESVLRKQANRKRMINAAAKMAGKPTPFPEVGSWGDEELPLGQSAQDYSARGASWRPPEGETGGEEYSRDGLPQQDIDAPPPPAPGRPARNALMMPPAPPPAPVQPAAAAAGGGWGAVRVK